MLSTDGGLGLSTAVVEGAEHHVQHFSAACSFWAERQVELNVGGGGEMCELLAWQHPPALTFFAQTGIAQRRSLQEVAAERSLEEGLTGGLAGQDVCAGQSSYAIGLRNGGRPARRLGQR